MRKVRAVEAIVVSPLTRALQTMRGAFKGDNLPIHVTALHTELMDTSGDVGRSPSELKQEFPDLDFSRLEEQWWYAGPDPDMICAEPAAHVRERMEKFRAYLRALPYTRIAVVGHSQYVL